MTNILLLSARVRSGQTGEESGKTKRVILLTDGLTLFSQRSDCELVKEEGKGGRYRYIPIVGACLNISWTMVAKVRVREHVQTSLCPLFLAAFCCYG